jgi:hypothetical protein
MEVSGQFHAPAALQPRKGPPEPVWTWWQWEKISSLPLLGTETWLSSQQPSHYTDWAIQKTTLGLVRQGQHTWMCLHCLDKLQPTYFFQLCSHKARTDKSWLYSSIMVTGCHYTNCLEHSHWDACSHLTSQEIPTFYGTQRLITMFTRSHNWTQSWAQSNPVHNLTSYFCKIHFNIILPSMLMSPKSSLHFRTSNWNFVCISQLHHMLHVLPISSTLNLSP